MQNEKWGLALEQLFNASSTTPAIFAALFFVLALIVLVWPPKKEKEGDVLGLVTEASGTNLENEGETKKKEKEGKKK